MSAALTEQLLEIARAAEAAGYGAKTRVYADGAKRLGMSVQTLLKHLSSVAPRKPRKRRADAGGHALTREEAVLIAATVEETRRLTGTGEIRLEDCVDVLRSEGKVIAAVIDQVSGEFTPLSISAIRRALQHYGLHPEQLAQPHAAHALASDHPNHVWQIDASISRQYYLADSGAELMAREVFYRGKPKNFEAINDRRLIRYNTTDHCTGHPRLFYVLRAESALNVVSALIHAMTPAEGIAMHAVPKIVNADLGTGRSATVQNFCDAMGIELITHARGNARALGSSENMNYLIETTFEAPLKLRKPVVSLDEINQLAELWCRHFAATRVHSRTGVTRRDGWLRITPEQLRLAPSIEVMRELAIAQPLSCMVRNLRIKFMGSSWDVSGMPGILNGAKVRVVRNAFDDDTARVLITGEDGRPAHFLAPLITVNEWGFESGAARIGSEYKKMPDTAVDAARKEIERLTMQVTTDAEAVAARKAKRLAFGGSIDPTKIWREAEIAPHLPRAGQQSPITAPEIIAPTPRIPEIRPQYVPAALDHVAMATALKPRVEARGGTWTADLYARMAARWPTGVTEEQLDDCVVQLLRGGLRIAGGAA